MAAPVVFHTYFYRSKAVLARLGELACINKPHLTPDGSVVLVCDMGGPARTIGVANGKPIESPATSPCLVPMAADTKDADGRNVPGGDMQHVIAVDRSGRMQPEFRRVEIPIDALGDLERLVEYDHLPGYRKDYSVYPKGHKLA